MFTVTLQSDDGEICADIATRMDVDALMDPWVTTPTGPLRATVERDGVVTRYYLGWEPGRLQ